MFDSIYMAMQSGSVVGLFLRVLPITLLVGMGYAVYRYIKIKRQGICVVWSSEIMRWLFVCYLTGLVNLVLVPSNLWGSIWYSMRVGVVEINWGQPFSGGFNLVPTFVKCLTGEFTMGSWVREMLTGNLLMFLPMGFFLPFISQRVNNHTILKIAVIIPVVVEIVQIVVGRSFDVDDLLLNFAGIILGYFVAVGVKALAARFQKGEEETA